MSLPGWTTWVFWILVVLVILVILWLISGKQKEPYIGATTLLSPLALPSQTTSSNRMSHENTQNITDNRSTNLIDQDDDSFEDLEFAEHNAISSDPSLNGSGSSANLSGYSLNSTAPYSSIIAPIAPKSILKKPQGPIYQRINGKRTRSKGEMECQRVMKELFKVDFYTVRPGFLTNPESGCALEIDVFNEDLTVEIEYQGNTIKYNIGVEYNGIQHVCWPNFTKQTLYDFIMQIRRDQYKLEECDRRNIYIITVPHNIPINMIQDYIVWFLPNNAINRKKQRDLGHQVIEYPPNFPQPPQIKIDNVSDSVLKETLARVRQRVIELGWASGDLTPDSVLPPRSPGIRY